jgi:hypothetical protein
MTAHSKAELPLKTNLSFVKQGDFNDDGFTDFLIEDAYIYCDLGMAARHGNGGYGVIIFAGTPNGVIEAFDKTVFGVYVEQSTVWIAVGGHYCGQETFQSRAAAISCDRLLKWDAKLKQFDFAPLTQARFPSKLSGNNQENL